MFCTKCGKELREGIKFCTNCGAHVKAVQEVNNAPTSDEDIPVETGVVDEAEAVEKVAEESAIDETEAVDEVAEESAVDETEAVDEVAEESVTDETGAVEEVAEESAVDETGAVEEVAEEPAKEPVQESAPFNAGGGAYYNGGGNGFNQPPKKKGNGLKIAGIILIIFLLLAVVLGVMWFAGGRFLASKITERQTATSVVTATTQESTQATNGVNGQQNGSLETTASISSSETTTTLAPTTKAYVTPRGNGEFIFPDSDIRYLTRMDLTGLNAYECRIARNEIYARRGRIFEDASLQRYFNSCSWYRGSITKGQFKESMLSKVEIANRDLIIAYEKEMGFN